MTDTEHIADLTTRNAELTERLRMVPIEAHVRAFSALVMALEDRKLTHADLHRAVSPERIRAAFIQPRPLRAMTHHA